MKPGATTVLKITVDTVTSQPTSAVFRFSQTKTQGDPINVEKSLGSGVTFANGVFSITLSETETRKFKEYSTIYMDSKITVNGAVLPTEIIPIEVYGTLFSPTQNT